MALAAYDTVRSYRAAVGETGRELDAQARVIAEQTARTLQTVDLVARHVADAWSSGKREALQPQALHDYLHDQAVGLVQIEGLSLIDADGRLVASSEAATPPASLPNLAQLPVFQRLREDRGIGLEVESPRRGLFNPGVWIMPLVRRLEQADGSFAGVVVAAFIPLKADAQGSASPLATLEHAIGPWVLFLIMPLFAFANAGVNLGAVKFADLAHPVTLGIVSGLLLGKVLGITAAARLAVALRVAQLPPQLDWRAIWGSGLLCGIGFTMSLFIGTLAFENADPAYMRSVRLGVLLGSAVAASAAVIVLRAWLRRRSALAAA